jgi:hypothetical protein
MKAFRVGGSRLVQRANAYRQKFMPCRIFPAGMPHQVAERALGIAEAFEAGTDSDPR